MADLNIKGVTIVETFAEAFPMVGTRIVITAPSPEWALIAARTMTGFATSVIACGNLPLSASATLRGQSHLFNGAGPNPLQTAPCPI